MISNRRHILLVLSVLLAMLMGGCAQEEFATQGMGTLHLSIGQITQDNGTRATPQQLGKPLAEQFSLRIQRQGMIFYDAAFVENMELGVGDYDITAYYGEDVVLGKDCPYYEGTTMVAIEKDASTSVTIPCRVANSLVSVVFGRDEEERARFDSHYTNYGLMVRIDDHSLAITHEDVGSSIYFSAGSKPTLLFYGTLRTENDELVWCEITSELLPEVFGAADHAIITLSLPDPSSVLGVNISKVDLEKVTVEETIPLSWLPSPIATARHRYNEDGELVGTDVEFSNSYPGLKWKAVVTNNAGEEVRSVEGRGELLSLYTNSSEWPYLPSGNYLATYYVSNEVTSHKVSSRAFSVGKPELYITLGGYSSYTKYLEGDIDAANACDPKTIYSPTARFNVNERLLAKYPYTFTIQYASMDVENISNIMPGKNTWKISNPISNQAISLTPYRLNATVSFDGVSVSNYKEFYITGLPVTYAPPTKGNGWTSSGTVTFRDSEVELGYNALQKSQYIINTNIAIPRLTEVALSYDGMMKTGWASENILTITIGSNKIFSYRKGTSFFFEKETFQGTEVMTLTEPASEIKCHNSYGYEQSYSTIYSLSLKYGSK